MAESDSKSGTSKQSTEKDTGLHCPVCKSRFERQHPEECVVLMVDLSKSDFLRDVNALLNGDGGMIYCHLQLCQMDHFFQRMQVRLTSLLPEDKLFYDVYNSYRLDKDHMVFEVKSGLQQVSTIDFKTKISTEAGIQNPTRAQMERLLSPYFNPPNCYSPEFRLSDLKEGLVIPRFYENGCIKAKAVRGLPKSTSNELDQMMKTFRLQEYISALSKLSRGGSVFLGIAEKIMHEPGIRIPGRKLATKAYLCQGLGLTESERLYLKARIPWKLEHEMRWLRFADDTHSESKRAIPVEIIFHDVATDEGSDLCVVEIKVHYFHGICFTQVDGPEAYRFVGAKNGIAHIERLSVEEWLDAHGTFDDFIPEARATNACSVDSGVFQERDDDFLSESEDESYICQACGKREQEIQVNLLPAGEFFTSYPIFSTYWQFSAKFTRKGGVLKTEDSDVMLLVPEEAVDIPSDTTTHDQDQGNQPDEAERMLSDTESPVDQKSQVVPDIAEAMEIKMAVSTDLDRAKKELKLAETENIVSPVAEFYAGKDFIFAKQVCILLPHALPVGFDENQVKVYHIGRDASGHLLVQTIPKWTADNPGDSDDFYMFGEQEIKVTTNHFSGVMCTYCMQHESPPHLQMRLYGKQTKRKRVEVDLKLLVWDAKLRILDFRMLALPHPKDESTLVSVSDLKPLSDASGVELGVQLDMRQEDIEWEHKFLDASNNPKLSTVRREELTSLLGCGKAATGSTNQGPVVIDWAFQHRDPSERSEDQWFSCTIDVGYVKEEEEGSDDNAACALQFLPKPKKLTLPVNGNDLKQSDTAQHSAHTGNTLVVNANDSVKRLDIGSTHIYHSNPKDTELTERKTLDSSPGSARNEQPMDAQLSRMEQTEGAAENLDSGTPAGTREFRTPTQDTQSEQPTHSNESEENA